MAPRPARDAFHEGIGPDLQDADNGSIEARLRVAFYNMRYRQMTPLNRHISERYAAWAQKTATSTPYSRIGQNFLAALHQSASPTTPSGRAARPRARETPRG
eukprot:4638921-Pyramimonas_sp.AAC.1